MRKTILIFGIVGVLIVLALVFNPFKQKSPQVTPTSNQLELSFQTTPSKTLKTYSDPSGFSFSYPDNLSILNNELKDNNSYAELQLVGKGMDGSLVLKIADSKLKSLDEWVKSTNSTEIPKETKLGNLKALEINTKDRLLLGSLDQGILFTMEVPQGDKKDFWMEVYKKVLADFSFAPPNQENQSLSDDVTFDGEEVVQ